MMSDSSIRTGWICIATEGDTVDNRHISAQWLNEMASAYNPDFYTAIIWPDHKRTEDAMGHVIALKAEKVAGKTKLFAVLKPSRQLQLLNSMGQYQFCSIEPWPDFAGTGKHYLIGLGVTNQPASTGTTHMQFSHGQRMIAKSEPLRFSQAKQVGPDELQKLIDEVKRIAKSQMEMERKLYHAADQARGFYLT
ncbi:GPO family capsid scaffolding protein [Zobellella sp. CGMCC 1.18722]|uniref:GPO family capsid scaffolding protein n=2 Tax=Zobellella iuensis TaxID=2803811 RepID=A0ABS1QP55_9GAMM|nr:GPO family capsid scaffolding protein [Zobellella iuensis]